MVYLFPESVGTRLQRVNAFYGFTPPTPTPYRNRKPYRLTEQARRGIIALALDGCRPVDIAGVYGVSESTVYRTLGEASRLGVYRTVWKGWKK